MRDIFITSSILILAILLIRYIVKGKINPCIQYALWLLVVIRLVLPMPLWNSRLSVMNLFPEITYEEAVWNNANVVMSGTDGGSNESNVNSLADIADETDADNLTDASNGISVAGLVDAVNVVGTGNSIDAVNGAGTGYLTDANNIANVSNEPDVDNLASANNGNLTNGLTDIFNGIGAANIADAANRIGTSHLSDASTEIDAASSVLSETGKTTLLSSIVNNTTFIKAFNLIRHFLPFIWIAGMIITGGYMLIYQIKWKRYLYANRKPFPEMEKYKDTLYVYTVDHIPSPCLSGRCIYLTKEMADDKEELVHILAHEYCHYKQLDSLWVIVRCMLTVIYWFNPLVWTAAYISKLDSELACDAAAIRMLGEKERLAYGKTLIKLVSGDMHVCDRIGIASTMSGGEKSIKERIGIIAKKPKYLVTAAAAVVIMAAVLIAFTFSGAGHKNDDLTVIDETELSEADASVTAQANESYTAQTDDSDALGDNKPNIDDNEVKKEKLQNMKEELDAKSNELQEMKEAYAAQWEAIAAEQEVLAAQIEAIANEREVLVANGDALDAEKEAINAAEEQKKLAAMEAELKAMEEEIKVMESELETTETELKAQEAALMEELARLGYDEDIILTTRKDGIADIKNPNDYYMSYVNQGENALDEGIYKLMEVKDEESSGIAIYGIYTKEFGCYGIKTLIGEDINTYPIKWKPALLSGIGENIIRVYEKAEDKEARTFAFKLPSVSNSALEVWDLYVCDRYDTGTISPYTFTKEDCLKQAKERLSFKTEQSEGRVYVYDNGEKIGEIDISKAMDLKSALIDKIADSDKNMNQINEVVVDGSIIDWELGDSEDEIRFFTSVGLKVEGMEQPWYRGLKLISFAVNVESGDYGERSFTLGKARIEKYENSKVQLISLGTDSENKGPSIAICETYGDIDYTQNEIYDTYKTILRDGKVVEPKDVTYINPCPSYNRISDEYGSRVNPVTGLTLMHSGIDFAAENGSDVVAAADGMVVAAGYDSDSGNYVILFHLNGEFSYYAHCSKILVSAGDEVKAEEKIAEVGSTGKSTGPHLHFAISKNGEYIEPMIQE
ncbi:MAG: peptidoglycan DD-metalloendopeptidase family protein [Lachnospiraceae bacterium]|nr:peptidoglycan DD-metalloendopeptidase family protein [Lachnospiraceae bacterium]